MDDVAKELRAVRITRDNVDDALDIEVREEQEDYVDDVADSLAEAYTVPDIAWPRLILLGQQPVGFVMAAFEPDADEWFLRCYLWRLLVDKEAQGKGVGRFAVELVAEEARRRGERRLAVTWVPGKHSPQPFWERLGFRATGEMHDGEHVAALDL